MPTTLKTRCVAAGALLVLVFSGCSGASEGTAATPTDEASPSTSIAPLTADQQRAQFAALASNIRNTISMYQFDADDRLPVIVINEDSIDIGGASFHLPVDGLTIEAFGTVDDLCVQVSRMGEGSAAGGILYASNAGGSLDSTPCGEEYVDQGPVEFPTSMESGFYQPDAVHQEIGTCFNETTHLFKLLLEAELPAWEVLPCSESHQYEVYGVAEIPAEMLQLDEMEITEWVWDQCDHMRKVYASESLGPIDGDWIWWPHPGTWATGPPKFQCIASFMG